LGNHYDDIYIQFKVKYSNGYSWAAGNNKLMITGTQDDRTHSNICCNSWMSHYSTVYCQDLSGSCNLSVEANNKAASGNWIGISPNLSSVILYPGQWYTIEFRKRLNTSGNADGIFEMWVNGTRVANYTNVLYRIPWDGTVGTNFTYGTNFTMLSSYINTEAPQNQEIYYDDIIISPTYIGIEAGDVTPPVCTITTPTNETTWPISNATVTVGGSATDGVGVSSVLWACPTCTPSSGAATCVGCVGQSVTWSQLVVLSSGANVFTATATDGVNTHADAITITYTPGVGPAEHSPSDVRGITLRGVKR
jgi:hypothetical protein